MSETEATYPATTAEETSSVTTGDLTAQQAENYPENPDQSNVPTNLSIQSNRSNMVSLYIMGNVNDAKAMFIATPGASESGWSNFERTLAPVRDFVVMGNLPYTQAWTGEYTGIANDLQEQQDAREAGASGGSAGSEVTLGTTTGQTGQAIQAENASGEIETTPLPEAQPTQTSTQTQASDTGTTSTESGTQASAADLIAQAQAAESAEELDAIEAQANGRVTVLNAVEARRQELG